MKTFRLSRAAAQDISAIFDYIASDNIGAAERVREDIYEALKNIARNPGMGHEREDLTNRKLLFWPIYSYLIVCDPVVKPLQVVGVLHGKRNIGSLLRKQRQPLVSSSTTLELGYTGSESRHLAYQFALIYNF